MKFLKKKIENLKEIISIMKLKSFSNSNIENDDFIIIYNNENLSNNNGQKSNEKFIYKDDIFEIIDALSLLNLNNNEINENFETNLMTKLNYLLILTISSYIKKNVFLFLMKNSILIYR